MTEKKEEINYDPKNALRLNAEGEIVPWEHAPVEKNGARFYSRNGKDFIYLDSPSGQGSPRRVNLANSYVGRAVTKYFINMEERGKLPFDANTLKGIQVYEGEIPFMKKAGKTYEYGGVKVDVGEQDIIVVDSRLNDSEKIATVFHELVHGAGYDFPKGKNPSQEEMNQLEKKTHLETISGLRKMNRDFRNIIKTDYDADADLEVSVMHKWETENPNIFKKAASYAIDSRESFDLTGEEIRNRFRRDNSLEGMISFFALSGSILFIGSNLTGNAIANMSSGATNIAGIVLFLVGITGAFFYLRKRKN